MGPIRRHFFAAQIPHPVRKLKYPAMPKTIGKISSVKVVEVHLLAFSYIIQQPNSSETTAEFGLRRLGPEGDQGARLSGAESNRNTPGAFFRFWFVL